MRKILLVFIFLFLAQTGLKAQQDPYFSTYLVNPSLINSSLSSTYDNNNVVLVYRNQWANYNPTNLSSASDSPTTGMFSLNLKSRDKAYLFGMNVISWSENLTAEIAAEYGVTYVNKETLCRQSDILSIHTKLSDRTKNLIGSKEISLMKDNAYIINTSRGPIIEEGALIDALNSKKIAGAGIDTFDIEPLPKDHPLLSTPNTLITPHIGYVTNEAYEAYYDGIIENVITFLNNNPVRVLNPDVLNKIYT